MSDNSSMETQTRNSPQRNRIGKLAGFLLLGTAAICFFWYRRSEELPEKNMPEAINHADSNDGRAEEFLIPEPAATPFRNAASEVAYVGNQACVACHTSEYESYLHTNHSRSLEPVDIVHEPPDGEFVHELSGQHYRVYRQDGKLRLREFIRDADGREVILEDHAANYALGSGNNARMYLVAVGEYLDESPMTWYPHKREWGMSAGYELDPYQPGFTREVGWGCMFCHSGRTHRIGGSEQRLQVQDLAISCERCHGPGELHVKERSEGLPIRNKVDDTIVNLKHLSRQRKEDICSQCHLSANADVMVRTRDIADFRPGMRMSDFRVSYRLDRLESARTVSGQILQLRLSRCYTQSETMTCATCHDPHSDSEESVRIEQYRMVCLNCHQVDSCRSPSANRNATQPADNCIACHMPKGPTDIPHFSFTHHTIGIHERESKKVRITESNHLVPVADISHLPELERLRLLGLANDQYASKLAGGLDDERRYDPYYPELSKVFAARSRAILEDVRARELRDAEVEEFFCRLFWRKNPQLCISHAEAALQDKEISPQTRSNVLFTLASTHFDLGHYETAKPLLEELVKMGRDEIALMLLGICYQKEGNLAETERLIKEAIRANPARADLHISLASLYRQMGDKTRSEQHLKQAELLSETIPQTR